MPYAWVGSKYAFEVCWNPWSLWSCNSVATFFFFHVAKRMLSNAKFTVCCELVLQATMLLSYKSRIIERDSIPCLVWMQEISVTHLWLGPSAWKSPFRRSPYLCSCRPGCCHFLCCRISNSKFAFLMIRRMVLGCFSFLSTSTSGDNHKWCPNIAYAARQWDRPVFIFLWPACTVNKIIITAAEIPKNLHMTVTGYSARYRYIIWYLSLLLTSFRLITKNATVRSPSLTFCFRICTPPMSWQLFFLAVWEWPSPACVVHDKANLLLLFTLQPQFLCYLFPRFPFCLQLLGRMEEVPSLFLISGS